MLEEQAAARRRQMKCQQTLILGCVYKVIFRLCKSKRTTLKTRSNVTSLTTHDETYGNQLQEHGACVT